MAFDPWAQYNQGLANLGQTFQTMNAQDLQRQQLALQQGAQERQNSLADLQVRQGNLALAEAQRKADYESGLREYLKTATQPRAGMPIYSPEAASVLANMKDPSKPIPQEQYQKGMADLNPAQREGKSIFQAQLEYAKQTGNADEYQKLSKIAVDDAIKTAQLAQSDPIAVEKYNQLMGTNLQYIGSTKDLLHVKDGEQVFSVDKITKEIKKVVDNPKDIKPQETWSEPYPAQIGGKQVILQKSSTGQVKPVVQDTSTTVKVSTGGDKTDPIVARTAVKDLQDLRTAARQAVISLDRYETMQDLLKNGAAGGLKGNLLAKASTFFDTPATSEADLFKKLAQSGAGALRMQTVGPGPVSNYENQLLQAISGGGNGARTATVNLINYYAKEANRAVANYNDSIDSTAAVAPAVSKTFKPITRGKGQTPSNQPVKSGRFTVEAL